MAIHDTVGDLLTSIRNSVQAGKASCLVPYSRVNWEILSLMQKEGFLASVRKQTLPGNKANITLGLKYIGGRSPIGVIRRCSTPGCRRYYGYREIPYLSEGIGIAILSTPKGILKSTRAKKEKVGGELICEVYS